MNKKSLAFASLLTLALGLTACDDDQTDDQTDDNGSAEDVEEQNEELEEEDEEAEEAAEEQDEEAPEASGGTLSFGETYTWDDGLAVTIGEPEEFTPGEWASGGEGHDDHLMFEVTVENNSGDAYDPDMTSITASSGGSEAESVFDSDAGLDGPSSTTLTDGQTTTYNFGFGVDDPSDLTVEFTDLDFDLMRESVLYSTN